MGTPSSPDHMKPIVQFCLFTLQHYLRHSSDCVYYPFTKDCIAFHTPSLNVNLHVPLNEEIQVRKITRVQG